MTSPSTPSKSRACAERLIQGSALGFPKSRRLASAGQPSYFSFDFRREGPAILDFKIKYIGLHSNACRLKGVCRNDTVNFSVSGVSRRKIYGAEMSNPGPMFVLGVKGAPFETHFSSRRKNWHVVLEGLDFKLSESFPGHAETLSGGRRLLLPLITPVPEERVFAWQNEFISMKGAMDSPTPENCLRAELGVASVFRFLMEGSPLRASDSPAARLKAEIDADAHFAKSLEDMSAACGYSSDHLRTLFHAQYQMSPKDYRSQRRVAAAMDLMANSSMTVKEIAWRLGFKEESSFSSMFKRLAGAPPRAMLRKLRATI